MPASWARPALISSCAMRSKAPLRWSHSSSSCAILSAHSYSFWGFVVWRECVSNSTIHVHATPTQSTSTSTSTHARSIKSKMDGRTFPESVAPSMEPR